MLVVMKAHATEEQVRAVCERVESLGYRAHAIPGAQRTAIGITGNRGAFEPGTLEEMSGVQEVIHFAAKIQVGESYVDPGKYFREIAGKTNRFLDALRMLSGPFASDGKVGERGHERSFLVEPRI